MQTTDISTQGVTLVIFKAPWCQPCKAYEKAIEKAKEQYSNVKFIIYDIEDEKAYVETLKYKVKGVPTTVFLKDQVEMERMVGALSLESLAFEIKALL